MGRGEIEGIVLRSMSFGFAYGPPEALTVAEAPARLADRGCRRPPRTSDTKHTMMKFEYIFRLLLCLRRKWLFQL